MNEWLVGRERFQAFVLSVLRRKRVNIPAKTGIPFNVLRNKKSVDFLERSATGLVLSMELHEMGKSLPGGKRCIVLCAILSCFSRWKEVSAMWSCKGEEKQMNGTKTSHFAVQYSAEESIIVRSTHSCGVDIYREFWDGTTVNKVNQTHIWFFVVLFAPFKHQRARA